MCTVGFAFESYSFPKGHRQTDPCASSKQMIIINGCEMIRSLSARTCVASSSTAAVYVATILQTNTAERKPDGRK